MHEASDWRDDCCFVTLTYSEEALPALGSLDYRDFQGFMKRLRGRFGRCRFVVCGEYGDQLDRPHFHALLFGVAFREDRVPWKKGESGETVFRSAALESLWPFGHSSVGDLSVKSAGYVCRYVMKKVTGDKAKEHYKVVSPETGEVFWKTPEFLHMSLKPGIGFAWWTRNRGYTFAHDHVVFNGVPGKPPRYYDKLLKRVAPGQLEEVQQNRILKRKALPFDSSDERLLVKEQVNNARISQLKRGFS